RFSIFGLLSPILRKLGTRENRKLKTENRKPVETFFNSPTICINVDKIDVILAKYSDRSELIDLLEEIQEAFGFVSEENMRRVEQKLKIPLVDIYGVATFYSEFKLKPSGRHIIKICTGTTCHVKNSSFLHAYLEEKLNVRDNETTKDGLFTLECVNCIGACAYAPAMMVDKEVYGNLTKEKIDEVLKRYR
ncbi:MAG: NADH-quinone oxidoreductase subunit NuoE, partial [Candidatus Altiarchaeales archaeon]|nr:NADH-quinone oxidoreductase subunit NuoE [Candidatus Altiarchaeales archaeon]